MKCCSNCGTQNDGFNFCPSCGKKMAGENNTINNTVIPLYPEKNNSENSIEFFGDKINVSKLASELNEIHESYEWGDIKKCTDGVMYKGDFLNGLRHGHGQSFYAYFRPGTVQCEGNWIEGKLNGFATCYNVYGMITFEGSFVNDEKQGKGKLYDIGKLVYEGEFEKNEVTGNGIVYYEDGTACYEGELKNYEPNGKGTYYHSEKHGKGLTLMGDFFEGEIYTGNWDEGYRTGFGETKVKGGDTYLGEWRNDARHGKGSQYLSVYNLTVEGEWNENELAKIESMKINGTVFRGYWKSLLEPEGEFEAIHSDGSIKKGLLIFNLKGNILNIDFLTDQKSNVTNFTFVADQQLPQNKNVQQNSSPIPPKDGAGIR